MRKIFRETINENVNELAISVLQLILADVTHENDEMRQQSVYIFLNQYLHVLDPENAVKDKETILSNSVLRDSGLNKHELLQIIECIRLFLTRLINCNGNNPILMSVDISTAIIQLVVFTFTSSRIYMPVSELHFNDIWSQLKEIIEMWVGIRTFNGEKTIVIEWEKQEDVIQEKLIFDVDQFAKLLVKVAAGFTISQLAGSCWWELYDTILDATSGKKDSLVLRAMHKTFRQTKVWDSFIVSEAFADRVLGLVRENVKHPNIIRFMCELFVRSTWNIPLLIDDQVAKAEGLLRVAILFFEFSELIFSKSVEESCFGTIFEAELNLGVVLHKLFVECIDKNDWKLYPPNLFKQLVSELSRSWASNTSTLDIFLLKSEVDLWKFDTGLLALLKLLQAIAIEEIESEHEKSSIFASFIVDLIRTQVLSGNSDKRSSFDPEKISSVINETSLIFENLGITYYQVREQQERLFSLINMCPKDSAIFSKIFNGLSQAIRQTSFPCTLLEIVCQKVASVDLMATWIELCIERQCFLSNSEEENLNGFLYLDEESDDQTALTSILKALQVPELQEEEFTKFCIDNAFLFTLYAHAQQKIRQADHETFHFEDEKSPQKSSVGNFELRIMIAEQIATWICSVKLEAAGDVVPLSKEISTESEAKILLLLTQFSDILRLEMLKYASTPLRSRLRTYLPNIADVLIKWGEDRATLGIWSTLGFGPKSRFSAKLRFSLRAVGVFIVVRLLDNCDDGEKLRVLGTVEKCLVTKEYEIVGEDQMRNVYDELKNVDQKFLVDLVSILDLILKTWYPALCILKEE
ncbi:Ectopic P granules protein 5 [Nowakowskiella sp. JEL0078]|nr:Ectopic P granules protein 5 [Nowakowskiella sp. JEL0078]